MGQEVRLRAEIDRQAKACGWPGPEARIESFEQHMALIQFPASPLFKSVYIVLREEDGCVIHDQSHLTGNDLRIAKLLEFRSRRT